MNTTSELTVAEQALLVALAADLPGTWETMFRDGKAAIVNSTDPRGEPAFCVARDGSRVFMQSQALDGSIYTSPMFRHVGEAASIIQAVVWFHAKRARTNAESDLTPA